jgi:hypothetical protein
MRPDAKLSIIPPLSVVKIAKVTRQTPAWKNRKGKIYRVGYYSKQDGLDCVWLVDDDGKYCEAVDQAMIKTHFEVLELSEETDLFGDDRPILGPRANQLTIVPPLSVVKVIKNTKEEPACKDWVGKIFRVGYYSKQDGLDCVWLVDDDSKYCEAVDQAMIKTHFEVLEMSDETDLFGDERRVVGPRVSGSGN